MQDLDDLARSAATGNAKKDADMAGARDAAEQIRQWVSISSQINQLLVRIFWRCPITILARLI